MFCLFALSASAGMVQAIIKLQLPSPLDLVQVHAFLDRASFSVTAGDMPRNCDLLDVFSAPSDANFSIATPSVMTQYSEGFDLLLLRLIPIPPYYVIFSYRKLVTTLDPISATRKVQRLFDLHIWQRQTELDSRDGAIDKASVTFVCLPDQLRRVYKFTRFVASLSNVIGVSPFVFESLGVPRANVQFIGVMTRRPSTLGAHRAARSNI
jgi:hypothetical protein